MWILGDRALNAQLRGVGWCRFQTVQRNRRDLLLLSRLAYALWCASRPNRRGAEPSLACAFVPAGFTAAISSRIFDGSRIVTSHADGVQGLSAPRCNWGENRRSRPNRAGAGRGGKTRGAGGSRSRDSRAEHSRTQQGAGPERRERRSAQPNGCGRTERTVPVPRAYAKTAALAAASAPGAWLKPRGLDGLTAGPRALEGA